MKHFLASATAGAAVAAFCLVPVQPALSADGPDDVLADDAANASTPRELDFGAVCAGATSTGVIGLRVVRGSQSSNNTFANGATVTWSNTGLSGTRSSSSTPAPAAADLAAVSAPAASSVPGDWLGRTAGTVGAESSQSIRYTAVSADETITGSAGYAAAGARATGPAKSTSADPVALKGRGKACDSTPPVITPEVSGTLGSNGWYVSDVSVTFTVTDPESPVTSRSTDCAGVVLSTDTTGVTYACTASSAGGTASESVTVKRDATRPTDVAVSPDRDSTNGWYNAPVTATWTGTDLTSGLASCTSSTYSGPDTSAGSLDGSCTDNAGNVQAGPAFTFAYDATGPTVVGTPDRPADHNGWYNDPVTVTWSATDSGSPISCDPPSTYDGADTDTGLLSGSCTDDAGNPGTGTFGFKFDNTAPQAGIAATRGPDHAGWYTAPFTAVTTATDPAGGSGVDTCRSAQVYGDDEPDTATGQLTGTCTDLAGNTSDVATLDFKYDATAPSATLTLDTLNLHNGWYNGPVTGTTTGSDNLSAVTCSAPQTYSGPDDTNKQLSGTCTDEAGNVSPPDTKVFNYDATAPTITLVSRTTANANGWNDTAVTVTWSCADATSLPVSDTVFDTKSDEGAGQTAHGTCQDNAGNTAGDSLGGIDIDLTRPTASISADRGPDSNGWYNHALVATTMGVDGLSGVDSCTADQTYGDEPGEPDTAAGEQSGTCTDKAGNVSDAATLAFRYDASAPAAPTVEVSPTANAAGWNRTVPVTVSFTANGDTGPSGVVGCTADQQVDAETAGQPVSGTCTDEAGNVSDPATVTVKIDVTEPNAPTLYAGTPTYDDWFKDSVTVTSSDNGDAGDVRSGVDPATVASARTFTTSGSHTVTDRVQDIADNESAEASLTVKVDASKPFVTLSCPAQVVLGSAASAAWSAGDLHSGIAGPDHGSVGLDSSTVGTKTATLAAGAAQDNVGHASDEASCSYAVVYGWDGFLQPINDTAHTGLYESRFKLGSTVPVRFVVKNAAGESVQSATTPHFQVSGNRGPCDSLSAAEAIPDAGASSGTAYRWSDGHYQYNFSTKGRTAGEYRVWATGIDDGVNHYVDLCLTR